MLASKNEYARRCLSPLSLSLYQLNTPLSQQRLLPLAALAKAAADASRHGRWLLGFSLSRFISGMFLSGECFLFSPLLEHILL